MVSASLLAPLQQSRRYLTRIAAADGHLMLAYVSEPWGVPVGGLVLIHEITGLNAYVRQMADKWAGEGYRVIAPSLFDRQAPGHSADYSASGLAASRALAYALDRSSAVVDVEGAIREARTTDIEAAIGAAGGGGALKVGVIGYCFGGSMTWLAATRIQPPPQACVSYYGRWVVEYAAETPRCPIILHYGEWDPYIPLDDVRAVQRAQPDVPVYVYPAGHGFACTDRDDWYDAAQDALAFRRSVDFFTQHLQGA